MKWKRIFHQRLEPWLEWKMNDQLQRVAFGIITRSLTNWTNTALVLFIPDMFMTPGATVIFFHLDTSLLVHLCIHHLDVCRQFCSRSEQFAKGAFQQFEQGAQLVVAQVVVILQNARGI